MRDLTYRVVIALFRLVFRALGLRFDVRGADRLPAAGPAVLACNHLSYLDFTFVGLAATEPGRLVRFMAKKSVFDNPVSGPLMRAMRHIPVDRASGAAAYRQATRAVRRGELVGIFPEATISPSWTLAPFKLGAATLAVKERVPLFPVIVWGGQRVLTVGGRFSLARGKAITVLIGEPILARPADTVLDLDAELRRRMQLLLEKAQREYPDQPRDDADRWWLPAQSAGHRDTPLPTADGADLAK
ncbi:MAG: 1-acyl-sn-glycerol-3-phosphate acyltransferase [Actinomycetota bacterium]|nr:1-acyl-sn-glycerol-3-phosphate acyltransferase [Actinomycetota bacterium]MDQ2957441.1 1-acyl-sn-glycerol-3-phosphate acyltransferase [Actinomycetota bacterium]